MRHLQEVDATFVDGYGILEKVHNFRKVKCLQDSSKTLWPFSVATKESRVVVVTIDNQSGGPQFDFRGWPIIDSCFIIFMFSR